MFATETATAQIAQYPRVCPLAFAARIGYHDFFSIGQTGQP
jgi:hypothetical protein